MDLLVPQRAKGAGGRSREAEGGEFAQTEKAVTPNSCGSQPDICREFSLYFPLCTCCNSLPAVVLAQSRSWECLFSQRHFTF